MSKSQPSDEAEIGIVITYPGITVSPSTISKTLVVGTTAATLLTATVTISAVDSGPAGLDWSAELTGLPAGGVTLSVAGGTALPNTPSTITLTFSAAAEQVPADTGVLVITALATGLEYYVGITRKVVPLYSGALTMTATRTLSDGTGPIVPLGSGSVNQGDGTGATAGAKKWSTAGGGGPLPGGHNIYVTLLTSVTTNTPGDGVSTPLTPLPIGVCTFYGQHTGINYHFTPMIITEFADDGRPSASTTVAGNPLFDAPPLYTTTFTVS